MTEESIQRDIHGDGTGPAELSLGELELEERSSLRRVVGLSTELEDITEVEYRQLRLERVVLVGVWTEGTASCPVDRCSGPRTFALPSADFP